MFEHKTQPLLPLSRFARRMASGVASVLGLVLISLGIGVLGYHGFEHLSWLDSLLNASMILGGMGPVDALHTAAGKLFASFYAIYSGLFLIGVTGVLLGPVFHRILHRFHEELGKK